MNGSFAGILGVTLPVFLLIGLGVFLRRSKLMPAEGEASMMKVIVRVFYPALILEAVGPATVVDQMGMVFVAVATGFFSIVIGFLVAWFLAPGFRLAVGSGRRTFAFTNGIYNYGYLPIPLIIAFYGSTDGTLAVLFVHNVGVDLAFWSVGIVILQGVFNRKAMKHLVNPPLIALVAAMILNYTGTYSMLPEFLTTFLGYLAAIAVPLGIILAGCAIGGLIRKDSFKTGWNVVGGACLIRLGLLPILFLVAAYLLPFHTELQRVVVIQAAMPAGFFPIVVAGVYGGQKDVAVRVVLSTMIVSVLTTPLWLRFGMSMFGGD